MNLAKNSWLRWTAWFLLATAFAVACMFLSRWQFERREEAVEKIERVYFNYDQPEIAISSIPIGASVSDFEWRPVELVGSYLPEQTLLVRNRAVAGQPGFIQLVPFQTTAGPTYLIERGWIAADSNLEPSSDFIPNSKEKRLIGRVRLGEVSANRDSPEGQVTSINLLELNAMLPANLTEAFYLRLVQENPVESSTPQPLAKPALDEGNHLSYAVQWILFALMAFFALFWAIRQEKRFAAGVEPKNSNRKLSDAEIEDELLDRS